MKIAIAGGGTAGLVAALILKTSLPNYQIDLIRSSSIGTIGVGEGSTEHWASFLEFIGVHPYSIIKHCDATFKSGIMFKNWSKQDYLHSVDGSLVADHIGTPFVYGAMIAKGHEPKDLVYKSTWNSQVPYNRYIEVEPRNAIVTQYHFNTNKLNDYLTKIAKERGIDFYDDEIKDILLDSITGEISQLSGKKLNYNYDFYVDCTGFSKLLIGKMGAKWNSYSRYLKMKQAIVFPTTNKEEIPYWTLAQALDYGWMFRIPVWERTGNGYIFDSDYISPDEAKLEIENVLGHEVEIAKTIKFDPGAVDRPWIKNVCAIGLSASFIEPLEASSIGTSIQQSFLLASRIVNYSPATIDRYNLEVQAILDNIRDFVVLHYITEKNNTDFWKDLKQVDIPDTLQAALENWQHRLPILDDLTSHTKRVLFNEYNYLIVLHGLGLFNIDSIKKQYNELPVSAKEYAERILQEKHQNEINLKYVPHKLLIDVIRNLTS